MIRKEEILAGQYGECLPGGVYAVLVPGSHINTSQGPIALPEGDQPLYLRMFYDDVNGLQMAGQSHASGRVWHYLHGGWTLRSEISHGQSGHIFDHAGNLHVIQPAPHQTSQGYRYVDEAGRLVLGDETYHSPALNLHEYTQYGGLAIGQNSTGGGAIAVLHDRRVLEPGDCRFIRFTRRGDDCAVAIVKLAERKTVLLWFTVDELSGFPLEPVDVPVPDPDPQPDPDPEPEPDPMPDTPNRFDVVQQVDAEHPHLMQINTHASCGEFVQRVLGKLDASWGHVGKTVGEQQWTPAGFEPRDVGGHRVTGFSHDVIWHQPSNRQVDIIGNATANSHPDPTIHGRGIPTWGPIDREHYRPNNPWLPAVPLVGTEPPPPPPPPNGDLRDAVTRLEIEQAAMRASLEEANRQRAALTGRLTALEGRPPGGVQPGHPVEVSGSISLSDAFSSRKVTWQGRVK